MTRPGRGHARRRPGWLALRLITAPVFALLASVLVFALPALSGIDPARAVIRARSAEATPDAATVARVTAEYGLDLPLHEQYLTWLGAALRGDLGLSYATRTPVLPQVLTATTVSVTLVVAGLLVAAAVGIPAGVLAARSRGGPTDRVVSGMGLLGSAVPEFVIGPVLVLVFAVGLRAVPTSGWGTPEEALLPVLTLAAYPAALAAQLTRAEMLDVLDQPMVAACRARGLSERRVLWRHAARNALTSVIALTSVFFAGLLGGAVVVEVIFAIPGLGRLLYDAVLGQDLPMLQVGLLTIVGIALVSGMAGQFVALAADPVARSRVAR